MDTPTIAKYYREKDPMERLKLLEQEDIRPRGLFRRYVLS